VTGPYHETVQFTLLCHSLVKVHSSHLGGVVGSVLATGLKGHRFKPGEGDWFLRVIKICSTPSLRWELKLEAPCHKILWHVKNQLCE
jgi:hypothetical protein